MAEGTSFRRMIPESGPAVDNAESVRKLLFCTGKVYYEIAKERLQKEAQADVAIARIEQVRQYIVIIPGGRFLCEISPGFVLVNVLLNNELKTLPVTNLEANLLSILMCICLLL